MRARQTEQAPAWLHLNKKIEITCIICLTSCYRSNDANLSGTVIGSDLQDLLTLLVEH